MSANKDPNARAVALTIYFHEPPDREDMMDHCVSAVRFWGGQYPPDHPLFPTNIRRIEARSAGHYYDTGENTDADAEDGENG